MPKGDGSARALPALEEILRRLQIDRGSTLRTDCPGQDLRHVQIHKLVIQIIKKNRNGKTNQKTKNKIRESRKRP